MTAPTPEERQQWRADAETIEAICSDRIIALLDALDAALIEQTRLINESSAWLAGADHARAQFRDALDEARAELETLRDDMAHQVQRHGEAIARAARAEAEIERLRAAEEQFDDALWKKCEEKVDAEARAEKAEAEAERLRDERDAVSLTAERMTSYARKAEAAIARVRALHSARLVEYTIELDGSYSDVVRECSECQEPSRPAVWPCATIAALDGGRTITDIRLDSISIDAQPNAFGESLNVIDREA